MSNFIVELSMFANLGTDYSYVPYFACIHLSIFLFFFPSLSPPFLFFIFLWAGHSRNLSKFH